MKQPFKVASRCAQGFTIVELVISTALLALLIQLAVPQFGQLLANWQRDQVTRSLTDHLMLARSEAIRWSQRVVMCNSEDGLQCALSANKEWKSGWLVFRDVDANGRFDAADTLVAVSQATSNVQSIRGNAQIQRLVFMPTGMMASGMGTIEIIPRAGISQRIVVNRIGRIRLSEGSSAAPPR
jgi:type IV fimbrial biogenesis protein FimT